MLMNRKFFNRTAFAVGFTLAVLVASQATAQGLKKAFKQEQEKKITVDAGGYEFEVPAPQGLVPLKKELKTLAAFMSRNAARNKLHEIYAAKGSTDESFQKNGLKSNWDIQTIRALDAQELDKAQFKQLKKLFDNQFDSMMKTVLRNLKDESALTIKNKEKVGSGSFIDNDSQYAYLFYSQVPDGKGKTIERVSASCLFYVDGKMLLANVHSNLESDKDATWVKTTAKKWLADIAKANK